MSGAGEGGPDNGPPGDGDGEERADGTSGAPEERRERTLGMRAFAKPRRLRVALLTMGVLAIVLAITALLRDKGHGDDGSPPATRAAALVPADALAYLHLSTDRARTSVERALELAKRFPSWPGVRDDLITSLGGAGGPQAARELEQWVGDEAALALLDTRGERAGSLILIEVRDRERALRYLERRTGRPVGQTPYRGTVIRNYRTVQAAFAGRFLALGPFESVRSAIDLQSGRGQSLAASAAYRKAARGLPAGRVGDAWVSTDGARRVLVPAGGVLGAAGQLLDRPGLAGAAAAIGPEGDGARVTIKSLLGPGAPPQPAAFEPSLLASVPADAIAMLETTGLDRFAGRLLGLSGGGPAGFGAAFAGFKSDLERRTGVDLDAQVLPLLRDEAAISIAAALPVPVLTIVARTRDEQGTREALARLQLPLARLLQAPGAGQVPGQGSTGDVSAFRPVRIAGADAYQLDVQPGFSLVYTVADGKLIASTSALGVKAAREEKDQLADTDAFKTAVRNRDGAITSLVFLEFNQLLGLGEQAGLVDDRSFARFRGDLRKLGAVGASTSTEGTTTSAEIFFEIR
ncbi:MAG: DUF3352 domain-containing protein [Solirubrobacteraceae bacterium]